MNRQRRRDRDRCFAPTVEGLEVRKLPSLFAPISSGGLFAGSTAFGSYSSQQLSAQAAVVRHEYDQYVGELKSLELKSQATPAEFLALRDDARAISAAASAANLPAATANTTAVDVSLQLDRAPLYGSAKDPGWALISSRVTTNLESLDVPQPLISQTLADMNTLATSANVSAAELQTFTNDFYALRAGEASLPSNPYYHFEDPGLFYSQHLRGFFRDWGKQKVAAEAKLNDDLRTMTSATPAGSAGVAVIHRDVRLLESLGAAVPSTTNQQLGDAYLAAFAAGVPTSQAVSELRSGLITILGSVATGPRIASIDRLAADAPAFAQAAGESASTIETIVTDVAAVVDAGGGETLNPFKITIRHASPSNRR
jgi:hypothetical protein